MGDVGDLWRDHKKFHVDAHIRQTRAKRVSTFIANFDEFCDLAALYEIEVALLNGGQQVQMRLDGSIANYYPSTRKFFFQKPLAPAVAGIAPGDVLPVFVRQARDISMAEPRVYRAWWKLDADGRLPSEVMQVGGSVIPQLREDVLNLASAPPHLLDRLDLLEFEHLVATLLERRGYKATVTAASAERGRDIIALRGVEGAETVAFFECKRYLTRPVNIDVVLRIAGARDIHAEKHSYIVTTARFTKPAAVAANLAREKITPVDRDTLHHWLNDVARKPALDRPLEVVACFEPGPSAARVDRRS